MTFWIIFGIIIGLVGLLALASKIKHGKQKIKATVQSTKSGNNVYKSKSTKSSMNVIKTSPIGDVHLIDYKHVVSASRRQEYLKNHKSRLRHVSIMKVDNKNNAKIADLITVKSKHKKDINNGKLIVLKEYSAKRGKQTAATKKLRSIDLLNNTKFKINRRPLNNKRSKLSSNDLNDYFNNK